MALAPLLQLRVMLRGGRADGVSPTFLFIIAVGAGLFCAYGISIADPVLYLPNGIGMVTNLVTGLSALRLRRRAVAQTS